MNDLYEVLETCLQEIENGADVDTVLFRHPEFAEELRPILGASIQAKRLAAADPSPDVLRRGRAKVLQQAAQMREARGQSHRFWSVPLRRALASLAVIAVLFMGSTGLVQASSSTLPGDNLYPVKRTWEDVRVLLTFDTQAREALEIEQENERIEELNELIAEGRSGKVDFAGIVTRQNGDLWLVSKIPVLISAQTDVRAPSVKTGDAVRVRGLTWSDGTVHAERVELLPAGIPLPSVGDEPEFEQETPEIKNESGEDNSGPGSGDESPETEETKAPEEGSQPEGSTLNGVVDSISGNVLIVSGQPINISGAEIKGTPKTGAAVKVEGFFDENGMFVVTKIEFQDSGSNDGSGSEDGGSNDNGNDEDSGNGQNDNSNDNGGEDNSNNHSSEDNSNDNSGSSGGSGGGDD